MMGVKAVPPMPPRLEMVNDAALHLGGLQFAGARLFRQRRERARDVVDAQAIGVRDHRHHQSIRRVGRETDVEVFLEDQILAAGIQRGIEARKFLQRQRCRP